MNIRIGQGYDVHAFAGEADGGQFITLGGVSIVSDKSLKAHSDGDVLIHALCDAMLGALSLGDIGRHFPDTESKYRNIDSRELLRQVVKLVAGKNYQLSNADMTIVAQQPKMAPHISNMCKNLAQDIGVDIEDISVKATTTEYLGFTGREEGIACYAVVLLKTKNK